MCNQAHTALVHVPESSKPSQQQVVNTCHTPITVKCARLLVLQSKFLKDYAQTHEALSKLGTSLPTVLFGGASAPAVGGFGSLADSYSTSEVMHTRA